MFGRAPPGDPCSPGLVRDGRRPDLDHLGADARDGRPRRPRPRRPAAGRPGRGAHARARARPRPRLALARPRAAQAPRLVARGRGRLRLRGRAPREGPRLRGVRHARRCCWSRSSASRRQFVAPGDPATIRPLVQVGAALTVCVPVALVYAYDNDAFSERIEEALLILIGALASARSGSGSGRCASSREERRRPRARDRARAASAAADSLAYFALRRDKSYFFSAERPHVPRLPRDRRHGARRRRPDRRAGASGTS